MKTIKELKELKEKQKDMAALYRYMDKFYKYPKAGEEGYIHCQSIQKRWNEVSCQINALSREKHAENTYAS